MIAPASRGSTPPERQTVRTPRLKAIIFDVDGTLAETEDAHRAAFNQAFVEAGLDWHWSEGEYRALLTTTGGRERIARHMAEQRLTPDHTLIGELHAHKNTLYAGLVASGNVLPRPGVIRLIEEARCRGVALAIATTTSRSNLDALLAHSFDPAGSDWFTVIVTGDDVARKKPHPEVYQRALTGLALGPAACVAIEDTENGLNAARQAGIATLVTPSRYASCDRFLGADRIASNLDAGNGISIAALECLLLDAHIAAAVAVGSGRTAADLHSAKLNEA